MRAAGQHEDPRHDGKGSAAHRPMRTGESASFVRRVRSCCIRSKGHGLAVDRSYNDAARSRPRSLEWRAVGVTGRTGLDVGGGFGTTEFRIERGHPWIRPARLVFLAGLRAGAGHSGLRSSHHHPLPERSVRDRVRLRREPLGEPVLADVRLSPALLRALARHPRHAYDRDRSGARARLAGGAELALLGDRHRLLRVGHRDDLRLR